MPDLVMPRESGASGNPNGQQSALIQSFISGFQNFTPGLSDRRLSRDDDTRRAIARVTAPARLLPDHAIRGNWSNLKPAKLLV